jgi:hypothetical protein
MFAARAALSNEVENRRRHIVMPTSIRSGL